MERHRLTITMEIKHEVLAGLLVTAVEGGSNYWAQFESIERDSELNILKVTVVDRDESTSNVMTPSLMLAGLEHLANRISEEGKHSWSLKPSSAARHFCDAIQENGDASTADVVLQMALFGEVLYG